MNICFLTGNGFDLNLGLETQYIDFLKIYREESKKDSESIKWFKSKVLEDDELWSSAERAFGICTKNFAEKGYKADIFCDCHEDFCIQLAKYLQNQEQKINYDNLNDEIGTCFSKAITNYYGGFREIPQNQILNSMKSITGGIKYDFITFNYTETLDKIVQIAKKTKGLLGVRSYKNMNYSNTFGKVLHVHGYTTRDMVFGVNDESQLSDHTIFEGLGEEYIEQLIKIKSNQMYEENTDEKVHQLLKNSDLIYIYGMSIGETDALWWHRICQIMKEKKYLQLIIHKYDAPERLLLGLKYAIYIKEMREAFVSYCEYTEEEKADIMSRIHIDISNIFTELKDLAKRDGQVGV